MADLELIYFDQLGNQPRPNNSLASNYRSDREISYSDENSLSNEQRYDHVESVCEDSAPWTATQKAWQLSAANARGLEDESGARWEDEFETSFTCNHEHDHAHLAQTSPQHSVRSESGSLSHCSSSEDNQELHMLSDDGFTSEASGTSVDYGFIIAVTCLVTGISLVAISYTVPRDVKVDPDTVSAREMERLEREKARVGAHLDQCVIAGLCLLTLGGVLLSTLLMISLWKEEMIRRRAFAYSKHSAKLYGSINLRATSSPTRAPSSRMSIGDEDLEVIS